jgi:hypothetical protein
MPPYSAKLPFFALVLLTAVWPAAAQGTPPPATPAPAAAPAGFAFANLRPALANVQNAISGLSISHWKAASATRAATQQDVASMQRDLSATLPDLMTKAEGASTALSPSFAVFRNIDALYDVLLRVTETAALAGPDSDASSLEEARAGLEDGRAKLGAWLLQSITAQDTQISHLQAPAPHVAAAPASPTKIVVNDGPEATKPRKKKSTATPPQTPAQAPQ